MIQKARKKPVVIEFVQFDGNNFDEIKAFGGGVIELERKVGSSADGSGGKQMYEKLTVLTIEGPLNVSTNDFIIKGIKGEFYPCKPDVFHGSYDIVDDLGQPVKG